MKGLGWLRRMRPASPRKKEEPEPTSDTEEAGKKTPAELLEERFAATKNKFIKDFRPPKGGLIHGRYGSALAQAQETYEKTEHFTREVRFKDIQKKLVDLLSEARRRNFNVSERPERDLGLNLGFTEDEILTTLVGQELSKKIEDKGGRLKIEERDVTIKVGDEPTTEKHVFAVIEQK